MRRANRARPTLGFVNDTLKRPDESFPDLQRWIKCDYMVQMAKSGVSLKLLIDTQAKRVLFAEASKECVDFLFHTLSLPMATIVSLLKSQGMMGSMINLYESVETLNESYMQPGKSKDCLLKPLLMSQHNDSSVPLLLLEGSKMENKFYCCVSNYCNYVSYDPSAICPKCCQEMSSIMTYVIGPSEQKVSTEGGFVKGLVTYMIMDNLVVEPMSSISCITMLNKFNVKDVTSLEEKVVHMGMDEAIRLLKASLQSDKVLTDVFLKDK